MLLPLLAFAAGVLGGGCQTGKPVIGKEATEKAESFNFWSPHLLLTADAPYRKLYVEIDAVKGAEPGAREIAAIKSFLEQHCRKPDGVRVELDDVISRAEAKGKSRKALAEFHLDGPPDQDSAYAYFLFYDSKLAGTKKENPVTTRIPYPYSVFVDRRYPGWWLTTFADMKPRLLIHEAAHLLGLSANQGHGDGLHCTNNPCLMNPSLYVSLPRLFLPGDDVRQKTFCTDCLADLTEYRDSLPPANVRLIGPYCVRSESGYHVVSTPGFVFIHVNALETLDLDDLRRRRHAVFTEHPTAPGEFYQTGRLDYETARMLSGQLKNDPLEMLRNVAEDLRKKLETVTEP